MKMTADVLDRGHAGREVTALTEEIGLCRSTYDIFKLMKRLAALYDCAYFFVVRMSDLPDGRVDRAPLLTNWPSEFHFEVNQDRIFDTSPTLHRIMGSRLPQAEHFPTRLLAATDPEEARGMRLMIESGQPSFAFIPVQVDSDREGAVAFGGERPPFTVSELMELSFFGQYVFHRVAELSEDWVEEETPLTDRETECLRHAAEGLTAAASAKCLGITPHTVNYHLTSATRKLEARNKVHATAIALRRKLI